MHRTLRDRVERYVGAARRAASAPRPRGVSRSAQRPVVAVLAAVLALAALGAFAGCASNNIYRDTFEGTRGALDSLRRHGPNAVDPENVRGLSASITRGLREGAGLPAEGPLFPGVTRDATRGALEGIGQGLEAGTTDATVHLVDRILRRLHGEGGPSVGAALLDDVPARLQRITGGQLRLLREELHLTLEETRLSVRGLERDLSEESQLAMRNNGRAFARALRDELFPAIGDGLRTQLAPSLGEVTRAASYSATEGMARGMERNLRPAVAQLREALFFGERQHTTLWILVALVGVLVVGVILLARNVRAQHSTQRALMDAMHQRQASRARSERRRMLRRRPAT